MLGVTLWPKAAVTHIFFTFLLMEVWSCTTFESDCPLLSEKMEKTWKTFTHLFTPPAPTPRMTTPLLQHNY